MLPGIHSFQVCCDKPVSVHGVYGVRIQGIDKLSMAADAKPSSLGLRIIQELKGMVASDYSAQIEKMRVFASQVIVKNQSQYSLRPDCLFEMFAEGRACSRPDFILNSLWCRWGYILDLDTEVLEIYEGDQRRPHKRGRYSHLICKEEGQFGYYPCALITSIPLQSITSFDPNTYLIEAS